MPVNWNDPGVHWNDAGQIWPFFSGNASDRRAALSEIRVTLLRAGRDPADISRLWTALRWSTNAVGGFGSLSLTLPGVWAKTKLNYGDLLRVTYGPLIMFEGRVEDIGLAIGGGRIDTAVGGFGLARLLDDASVRRIWSKRDLAWAATVTPPTGVSNGVTRSKNLAITSGNYDPADLTKSGVQAAGTGIAIVNNEGEWLEWFAPIGVTLTRLLGTVTLSGGNTGAGKLTGQLMDYVAGWGGAASFTVSGSVDQALRSSATALRLGGTGAGAVTPTATDLIQFSNLRVLGTTLVEDVSGGFYGSTILRDLIGLVPGLTQGVIETGSDFTIQAIERSLRDTCRSVVAEVASYYAREWGVWESGRFDWKTPNLDEPQWIAELDDLISMNLQGTIEGIERTSYVLYTDAASQLEAEASSVSVDQRNPFVKQGSARDGLTRAGFPMTSTTSAGLASRLSTDRGRWPPVTGSITLPILQPVAHASHAPRPAFTIRAGENVRILGLPRSDLFTPGRDGETFFHISSSDVDLAAGTVQLTLEGQTRASDLLLARLAAVTRTLTG